MDAYYSANTGGFYLCEIHGYGIPSDAVEITGEEHRALLAAQSEGKIIQPDEHGFPVAVDRPAPSPEAVNAIRRFEILAALNKIDLASIRALRAKQAGKDETADDEKLVDLDAQAVALRAELAGL